MHFETILFPEMKSYDNYRMKKAIKTIQKDIEEIFRSGRVKKPLHLLTKDNCSEASRLVAIWVKRIFKRADFYIAKGEYKANMFHDILIVHLNDAYYVIDPTITQFFKRKRTILMGEFAGISAVFAGAKKIYGGKWERLEKLSNFREEKSLIKSIRNNL